MPYLPTTTKYKWIRRIKKDYVPKTYSKPEHSKIYNTTRWRKLRGYFIKNNPLCKLCKKKNITTVAKVVDHIVEIADGGGAWDFSNLQSLCDPCHRVMTAKAVNLRKKNTIERGG